MWQFVIFLMMNHISRCDIPLARRKVPESAEPITPMVGGAEPTALALREPVGTRQIQVRAKQH